MNDWKEELKLWFGEDYVVYKTENAFKKAKTEDLEHFIESLLEQVIEDIPDRLTDESYQATASMLKQQLKAKWLN